ncbi:uncharacterized protein LOC144104689 isoform X3 [Amblyomma americanum]
MAPGSVAYTLVGFSADLDWRPLLFVKPLPPHRVCDAWGLVRKWTALLPCRHTLCESCYELSIRDSTRVCPLDGHRCEDEDVFMKEFPADELLRREVRCSNEVSDCRTVLPASQIGQHFHRECRHHSIRCPRCSARVLCTDVCAHLKSECCTNTATPAGSECQGDSGRKEETALLTSFMQSLEAQAGELKALMERVLVATGDRLNEVVHGVNSCQEALREELRLGISSMQETVRQEGVRVRREHRESLKKCSDEIAARSEETKGRLIASSDAMNTICNSVNALEKVLRDELAKVATEKRDRHSKVAGGAKGATQQAGASSSATGRMDKAVPKPRDITKLQTSVCEFVVKGVKSLEEQGRKEGMAEYECERVYLRGYCMSPGVYFMHYGDGNIWLRAFCRLRKGDMDDVVEWPFRQRVKLSFIHPKGGKERVILDGPIAPYSSIQRPQAGSEQGSYIYSHSKLLGSLTLDDFVKDDQLRIKFEIGT